jgi:hypothetical protein
VAYEVLSKRSSTATVNLQRVYKKCELWIPAFIAVSFSAITCGKSHLPWAVENMPDVVSVHHRRRTVKPCNEANVQETP